MYWNAIHIESQSHQNCIDHVLVRIHLDDIDEFITVDEAALVI